MVRAFRCEGMAVILGAVLLVSPAARGQEVPRVAPVPVPVPEMQRSISASGQFRIFGMTARDRGVFCEFSEQLRRDFEKVLNLKPNWKYPVVIQLHTRQAASRPDRFVAGDVRLTTDGFRFQIDVLLAEGFGRREMSEELLRVLLLEKMLAGYSDAEEIKREGLILPHWVHYGVLELVRYRQEGTPNDLFAEIIRSNRFLPVGELLEKDPAKMNSVSRAVFGASAAGLVRALLEMDAGAQRLVAFMEQLPGHPGNQIDLLRRVYPDLANAGDSLEKWWSLELALMARPMALDFLDAEETEARLQEALTVRYQVPVRNRTSPEEEVVCHLSDLERLMKLKKEDRASILTRNDGLLMKLSLEGFPAYRALINSYRLLVGVMISGKSRGLEESFKVLEEHAYALGQALRDIEDYINWYEGTKLTEVSGAFENYRDAVDELERKSSPRRDRISKYLDRMEEELDK